MFIEAVKEYNAKHYTEALKTFKSLAKIVDLDTHECTLSLFFLGNMHKDSEGVEKDLQMAISSYLAYIQRASNDPIERETSNFASAYFSLGLIYNFDLEKKDFSVANKYYIQASFEDYALALQNLAFNISEGIGIKKDPKTLLALNLYRKRNGNWDHVRDGFGDSAVVELRKNEDQRIEEVKNQLTESEVKQAEKLSQNKNDLFKAIKKLTLI